MHTHIHNLNSSVIHEKIHIQPLCVLEGLSLLFSASIPADGLTHKWFSQQLFGNKQWWISDASSDDDDDAFGQTDLKTKVG